MPIPAAAEAPLVLTARLDPDAFAVFDELRRRWFPPEMNKVPAHLSLFHHLPGDERRAILEVVRRVCATQSVIRLDPLPPRFLGRGVALAFRSDALAALHRRLANTFSMWLMSQDRQPFKAHVTIQNKVTPEAARTLRAEIALSPPVFATVEGIDVWRYVGGAWSPVVTMPFAGVSGRRGPPASRRAGTAGRMSH